MYEKKRGLENSELDTTTESNQEVDEGNHKICNVKVFDCHSSSHHDNFLNQQGNCTLTPTIRPA